LDLIHILHKNQMNFLCRLNSCMNLVVLECLNHFQDVLYFKFFAPYNFNFVKCNVDRFVFLNVSNLCLL